MRVFVCVCEKEPQRDSDSVARKQFSPALPLLLALRSLHLSVGRTELMDVPTDGQTASCAQCGPIITKRDSLQNSSMTTGFLSSQSVCVCTFLPCMVICPFFSGTICPIFPLLTTKINKLCDQSKQAGGCGHGDMCPEH